MMKNSSDRYGVLSRAFHWITAVLILAMLLLGNQMVDRIDALRPTLFRYHRAVGLLVLFLVVLRLAWAKYSPPPSADPGMERAAKTVSRLVHWLLYSMLIVMPVLGWLMSSASGEPIMLPFGVLLPAVIDPDPHIYIVLKVAHRSIAVVLVGFVLLHIAGALNHLWIKKDAIFDRMG